ncbi:hypothetical protein V2E29_04505 [Streptomyces diastatochromogenes]|uniref:hypothetical protein n=1 Tax=Streptomyces diastatochromogenes TaxID=42236 RepID=UPI002F26C83A
MWNDLTGERRNALHWAAVAYGMKVRLEVGGDRLSGDQLVVYERYQANAREHGFTDADIRDYCAKLAAA